jgi:very-short-patch-repair endonuclease
MATRKLKLARTMRKVPTAAERVLWRLLRDRKLEALKFRRQVPIGPYVADFVCLGRRLIVEADGPFHDAGRDALRDAWLMSQGFRVLRFRNEEIVVWPDRVLDQIRIAAGHEPILCGPLRGEILRG